MFGERAMRVLAGELAAEGVDMTTLTIAEAQEKMDRIRQEKADKSL
jgi:hypothetical protein